MKQISECADILMAASGYMGYLWAADKFCKKILGASKRRELLFLFSSFLGWLLLEIMNRQWFVPYIFSVTLNHILLVGLVLLFFEGGAEKKILAAFLLMLEAGLVRNVCEAFLACVILIFRHTVKKIPVPFIGEREGGLIACIGLLAAAGAVCLLAKHFEPVFCGKPGKWYAILAAPLVMLMAVFDVVCWGASNGIMVRSGGHMGLYYDQIFSNAEFLGLGLLVLAAAGFYVLGMERIYLEQEKSSRYHSQIAVYKMLEEQYSQSERLRHDMKNHIIALSGLFESREWEKLGDYLKQLEESGLKTGSDMTGNKAVDALLYQKRKRAEREKIRWECDIQIPKICCIKEFDLCILFGNILDNALEACERMLPDKCSFINIQARGVKKCLLLEVKNSMDEGEKYTEGFTCKENLLEHGFGLLNVRDVVYKYNGAMHTEVQDKLFVISILIPLSGAAHDDKRAV